MTTLQRLTVFGTSDHGFERMEERATELQTSSWWRILDVTFQDYDTGLGFDGQSWFVSGLVPVGVDRLAFEAELRDVINDHCWVLTEAEQSFDWSLPGIEDVRPDLACLLLRDHASVLDQFPVGHRFRACYLGSPVPRLSV